MRRGRRIAGLVTALALAAGIGSAAGPQAGGAVGASAGPQPAAAAEPARGWPQFRGAARDGTVPEASLEPWPEAGPKVLWRRPIGTGFSALSVAGERFYTMFAEDEVEHAAAFEAATGTEIWRAPIGESFHDEFGNGPRSTPTVDGDTVFVLGSHGKLAALAAADGAKRWEVDLVERFGSRVPQRGFAFSPLVDGELVLIRAGGGEGKAFAALDRATGETRWTALDGGPTMASPIVATVAGARQYVFAGSETVTALSAAGEVLWTYDWERGTIAMPIFIPPDKVFVSASYDVGAVLLQLGPLGPGGAGGDAPPVRELWRNRVMKNHFSSSVHREGHVYGFDGATLKCVSLSTGEQTWAKRGFGKGSLILVGDKLVVLADQGTIALLDASPDGYVERARFQALEGKSWTAPAYAGGRLYLRNLTEMMALELGEPAG